ncbi:MFS transporter [Leucobacter sp. USHLN153]|uniref:MFS transporter n=1 Tax=Leucobacter sp. USHLN153 TaxID=3081268 RepID=UPI00301909C2
MTRARAAAERGLPFGLALAGLLLTSANLRASLTSVGPILDLLRSELGLTSVASSMLISLPLLAFAGVSPIVPAVAARVGLERLLGGSLVFLAVGIAVRSIGGVWLWVGTIVLGVAIAAINVALPGLVKRDFPLRIGQITGAYTVVQSSVAAIAAGVSVPLAGSPLGWRLSLGIWAGFALVALAVLMPRILRAGSPRDTPASAPITLPGGRSSRDRFSPWRSPLAWQITAFMGMQSVAYYVIILWLPSIEVASGITPEAAGVHLFLMNAISIAGSLLSTALIPRLRDQRVLGAMSGSLFVVTAIGLAFAPEWSALWASLSGVSGGMTIVLALSLFGLRTHHHRHAAAVSGMAQSIGYLSSAVGTPVIGLLHDVTGSWAPALWTIGVIGVLLMGLGILVGRNRYVE